MDNGVKVATPRAMVENVLQLISLPEIYLRLQNTIDDPLHSREQIAEVITYDPALSARVLRIANSSYYSFPREIETVVSAVGIIGELDLRNLVLVTTVVGSMSSLDYRGVDIDAFWLHSLRCAIIARLIAQSAGGNNPEILFLAGMLHDLGILVIYQQDPTLAGSIARQMEEKHQLRDQAERELLGFDHAEVGALLIEAWGLSAELTELTRCHHQYQLAQDNKPAALMLALANLLADADTALIDASDIRFEAMMSDLGISQDSLEGIIESGEQQCQEVKTIILG
jgi:HD-like signal output (HDOD) protein